MCYSLILSTTSDRDLAVANNEAVIFSRVLPEIPHVSELKYVHKWFVGSRSGCSCSFRHLYSVDLGFSEPVEWYAEDQADIDATLQVIAMIRELVESGESVDCIDAWRDPSGAVRVTELTVDLERVSDREFRFFENHHFVFVDATPTAER